MKNIKQVRVLIFNKMQHNTVQVLLDNHACKGQYYVKTFFT